MSASDQRSVGSSPRLIAASHVLHRLLVPRHPPCALNNLTNTLFVLDKTPPIHRRTGACAGHKRCSRPLCSARRPTGAPPRPPPPPPAHPPHGKRRADVRSGTAPARGPRTTGPLPQ